MAMVPGGADRPTDRSRPAAPAPSWPTSAPDEAITVELAGVRSVVQRSRVIFVQAQGDYARLHTAGGSHLVRVPLSVLAERWAPAGFVRIHRSTLIALPYVEEVTLEGGRFCVRLGGRVLRVSRRSARGLRELLKPVSSAPGGD